MYSPYKSVTDAAQALALLQSGNARFAQNKLAAKDDYAAERALLTEGQHPFAVVLTCSDSRTPPEIFFDQKLGDLFVVRNAGNIAEPAALGSIEYAVAHLHPPLVAVIGHSQCGAVCAAYQNTADAGHLQTVLEKIRPACAASQNEDEAIRSNIRQTVAQIRDNAVIKQKNATVAGGYYDLATGQVTWLVEK